MAYPFRNPITPEQVNGTKSVSRSEVFGTNFSVLGIGGYMEVYNLSDLLFIIPSGSTGTIEYTGNSIPINFVKGTGSGYSPDVLVLGSDNLSSGRRRLGMLAYVYETDQIYQYRIDNYDTLWATATGATGVGGDTVVISEFGATVKNNSVAGQNFINAWTANTIEDVSGETSSTAVWKKLTTGGGGSGGTTDFSAVSINSVTQFTSLSDKTINFSGINVSITSAATNTLVFSAGTGGSLIGDYLPLSGGTVTGDTIFTSGLTATTISATTYDNLPVSAITAGSNIVVSNSNGNVTISQNNAGTNVLWKDVTLYTSNVAANTILASKLIPANTFQVGDFYEYTINFSGNTPNGTSVTRRVYINTSASLVGAQQLSVFTNSVGTNQYTAQYRHGFVLATGTTGSFNSLGQITAISSILFNNSATQIFTINTTIDQYFIVATQVASTIYTDGFRGINLRITR